MTEMHRNLDISCGKTSGSALFRKIKTKQILMTEMHRNLYLFKMGNIHGHSAHVY